MLPILPRSPAGGGAPIAAYAYAGLRRAPIGADEQEEAQQFQHHLSDDRFFQAATDNAAAAEANELSQVSGAIVTRPRSRAQSPQAYARSITLATSTAPLSPNKRQRPGAEPEPKPLPLFLREPVPKETIRTAVSKQLQEPVPVDHNRVMLNDNQTLTASACIGLWISNCMLSVELLVMFACRFVAFGCPSEF